MFLSTENPSNDHPLPSPSSSSFLHLTKSSDELAQSHLHNFSIRDYAYSNRKNKIKNNWPFSPKSLQLLSTHGVTDPLPPFQKVTTHGKQINVQLGRDLSKLRLNQTLAETRKGVCSQLRIVKNGLFTSTSVSKSKEEIVVAGTSNNNKNNKSKKCGRGRMVKSKEDSCGGLLKTSRSIMSSKTCPICKTFSSASNTTLNAHIDQCMSVDAAAPPVISKPNKLRVNQCLSVDSVVPLVISKPKKPRGRPQMKVKTMVDIYATAKGCTLEDLDKRNGTKWASALSHTNRVVADKSQVFKKRKVPPVGVGPVYIDAKGQKLRILTEFKEKKISTTTPLSEQHEDGSNGKRSSSQGSKENSKSSRKRRRGKKQHKYLKLNSHKTNASEQIPEYQRGVSGEGSSTCHRRIYNQRMLANRGLSSKKLNEKGHKFYALRDQPSEDEDDDGSWSEGDHVVLRGTAMSAGASCSLKKQKLRSEVPGSSKTMFVSKRAQRVQISEKEETSLAGGHLNTVRLKRSLTSIQEDKYPLRKNLWSNAREVSDASPRATSMRKLLSPFVANGWRRLSLPVELKRARLDLSEEEEEEETGKWEAEMTQEHELSDDDYVSSDNGEINEVLGRSNPSTFSVYDDDDEESSEEEEDNNKGANGLEKTIDTAAEFYQSDTPPSNETIRSEREMYYTEEVGNIVYRQSAFEEDVRFDSELGKGSLFVEVDTIPIPGPPGSFIPSPRGMSFDENLGNSSVITSQIQSSMDQLDRNSSESPVSNFAAGRLNFPLLSPDIPSSYMTTPVSFSVPSHHGTITEAEQMTVDKTTTPLSFRNNDLESCCCQRKERISEGITFNQQPSHLLQRRAVTSSSIAMNVTKPLTGVDPNHLFEQSPYMIQQEFDLCSNLSNKGNFNAVVVPPSPSNPVLRLMGKDLMIMNQGEADNEEASRASLKPTPQFHHPAPYAGTGLYSNTGLYLRNSFESAHQPETPQAQTQASPSFKNNFHHGSYFSPSC